MKASKAIVNRMREAITPHDTETLRHKYRNGDFPRAELVKDLNKRYRWDLARMSGFRVWEAYDEGLNDSHIDTALRSIVPAL